MGSGSVNTARPGGLPAFRVEAGEPATGPTEELGPEERARETAVLMLRRTAIGLERDDFRRRTGFDIDELAGPAIERNRGRGYLEDDRGRLRLSREGIFVGDDVLSPRFLVRIGPFGRRG